MTTSGGVFSGNVDTDSAMAALTATRVIVPVAWAADLTVVVSGPGRTVGQRDALVSSGAVSVSVEALPEDSVAVTVAPSVLLPVSSLIGASSELSAEVKSSSLKTSTVIVGYFRSSTAAPLPVEASPATGERETV